MKELIKMNYLRLFCIFSLLFLNSCNGSDNSQELSGGYFYRDESAKTKDILNHSETKKEIYSTVIDYNYNSDFIIAEQEPNYDEYRTIIGFKLRDDLRKYPTNSEKERIESEKVADSILKHNSYYKLIFQHKVNYWIIENKTEKTFGPLTKEEFKDLKIRFKIPLSLKLQE